MNINYQSWHRQYKIIEDCQCPKILYNNINQLLSAYYIFGNVLGTLCAVSLILTIVPQLTSFYSNFKVKFVFKELPKLPRVAQVFNRSARLSVLDVFFHCTLLPLVSLFSPKEIINNFVSNYVSSTLSFCTK